MTTVQNLQPGDRVTNAGMRATYIAQTDHPIWPNLRLVIWRMADRSWSHDALSAQQEIGAIDPASPEERLGRLRAALLVSALTGEGLNTTGSSVPLVTHTTVRCAFCGGLDTTHKIDCPELDIIRIGGAANPERSDLSAPVADVVRLAAEDDKLGQFRSCPIACGWTQSASEYDDEIGLRAGRSQHLFRHSPYEIIQCLDRRTATPATSHGLADSVLGEVIAERARQDIKWGEQNHPDGTGRSGARARAIEARRRCQLAAAQGNVTWQDIYDEEIAEAFAESEPAPLRSELIQVAAVAIAWIEAIDRRLAGQATP